MRKIRTLGVAMLGCLVAANAYASSCVNSDEITALETAALQQELMVAAFTCRHESRYNQFVRVHRPALIRADDAVKAFFVKRGKGEAGYHTYKTDLANGSAMSSARADGFCMDAAEKFERLQGMRHLGGFTNASLEGYSLCRGVVRTAQTRSVSTARVAERSYSMDRRAAYSGTERARPRYARDRYAYRDRSYDNERDYYEDDRRGRYDVRYREDRYAPGYEAYGPEADY